MAPQQSSYGVINDDTDSLNFNSINIHELKVTEITFLKSPEGY